jgi:hypothetical protein
MKMDQTGCSETSAYKIRKPENSPEENTQQVQVIPDFKLSYSSHLPAYEDGPGRVFRNVGI